MTPLCTPKFMEDTPVPHPHLANTTSPCLESLMERSPQVSRARETQSCGSQGESGALGGIPSFPWSSNIPQRGNATSRSPVAKWRTFPCWMLSGRSCGKEWNWGVTQLRAGGRKPTGLAESPHSHPTPISFRETWCPHSSPPGWSHSSQGGAPDGVHPCQVTPQPDPRLRSPAVTQDSGRH